MSNKKSLLLVEGKSEEYVIKNLCPHCNIDTTKFEIKSEDCIDKVKTALKIHLKSTNLYNKIWVIIDADTNFEGAWQSIRNILINSQKYSSLDSSKALPTEGFFIMPDNPNDITIGVWIMPNNTDIGMLEDFLISLIKDKNSLYPMAISAIDELESRRANHSGLYKGVHKSKAMIHTWLAWQDHPGMSFGTAINKSLFDTNKQLCTYFTNWLRELQQP